MKAISLWQPRASAMAHGLKRNETRGHLTRYLGDLVICSALREPVPVIGHQRFFNLPADVAVAVMAQLR